MNERNGSEFGLWTANLEASSSRRFLAMGLLLVAWLLTMILVTDVLASEDPAELAANPELAAAERYTPGISQSATMAANPELAAAGRYAPRTEFRALAAGDQRMT